MVCPTPPPKSSVMWSTPLTQELLAHRMPGPEMEPTCPTMKMSMLVL
jgi:hypothetical protein